MKYFNSSIGKIAYQEKGKKNNPVMITLHGYLDTKDTFFLQEKILTEKFRLYSFDWPGHGDSPLSKKTLYTGPSLLLLLHEICSQFSDPVCILGHSMGAAYAAKYAGLFPDRISNLILFEGFAGNPPVESDVARMRSWADGFVKERDEKVKVFQSLSEIHNALHMLHPGLSGEIIQQRAAHLCKKKENGYVWHFQPMLKKTFVPFGFSPHLSRYLWQSIRSPVCLMFGEKTKFHPGRFKSHGKDSAFNEISEHFKNIKLHIINDAGHNFHHDNPVLTNKKLLQYLETNE